MAGSDEQIMLDRLVYLLINLVGMDVRVQMKNGQVYEGIFAASNVKEGPGIVLKMANKVGDPLSPTTVITDFLAHHSNIVQIECIDVDVTYADHGILSDRRGIATSSVKL